MTGLISDLGTRCGQRSASRPAALYPRALIGQDAEWGSDPIWTQRLEEKSFASAGKQTPVVQSIVRHGTDRATPAPRNQCTQSKQLLSLVTTVNCLRETQWCCK
jgi:hypothetical protein